MAEIIVIIKNWVNEAPRPESLRIGLVIAHGPAFVAYWDIRTRSCVGRLVVDRHVSVELGALEEYGTVIIGAYILDALMRLYQGCISSAFQVMAISIDYIDPTAVSISVLVTTIWLPDPFSQGLPGHCRPRHTGEESVIKKILPKVRAVTYAAEFYLMLRYAGPSSLLFGVGTVALQLQLPNESSQMKIHPLADPIADVVTITAGQSAGRCIVEFWLARSENGGLTFGDVSSFFVDPAPSNVVPEASGIYALLGGSGTPLRLLRFGTGGSPILQELKIPGKTLYVNAGQVALDDHVGLVPSLRGDETLRIISYA
ncbi:hypothetical protein DFH09DRAFT_1070446 [Mycena vulgaris]|nr:hypothetical protein DFH09DRAFT_1070446 [Mycena vulgaris]